MDHFSSVTEVFKHAANKRVIEKHTVNEDEMSTISYDILQS